MHLHSHNQASCFAGFRLIVSRIQLSCCVESDVDTVLQAVMAGMVEDCNRYFRTVQEQEQIAAKHTHKISELVVQNAALQAELEKAHLVTEMQSAELNECRTMLRDAEHGYAKR